MKEKVSLSDYFWTSRTDSWTSQCTFNMAGSHQQYPLHDAAKLWDISTIQQILKNGLVDVNSKDDRQCTALYYVISRERPSMGAEAVRSLCEHGADVNEKLDIMDPTKPTYLFTAMCEYSHGNHLISIMRALLDAGANPNIPNIKGKTPLFMACCFKRADVVDLLLAYGANVNMCDTNGSSPLHAAVAWCNPFDIRYSTLCNDANVEFARIHSVVQKLLDKGAVVNLKNHEGNIPLHLAITNSKRRYIDMQCTDIDILLRNKSDIYTPSGFDGLNALQLAAKNGKNEAVKFCLELGMNPNLSRSHDHSPLNLAVKENHPEEVRTLLEHGAQIQFSRCEFSVLHTAAFEGLHEMVTFLLEQGANPRHGQALHWIRECGQMPLLVAGHVSAARTLVAKGALLRVDTSSSARSRKDHGLLTLHFLLRSQCGNTEYQGKLSTIFYNPYLQQSFANDIFRHLVQENAIVVTENKEICFRLEWRHLKQFFRTICPKKLNILRSAGFKFMLFSSLMRTGSFLVNTNKICQKWREFYLQLRQPLSLKEQGRIAIRRAIPAPLSASVDRLSYPKCMQEYLLMPEIQYYKL